MKRFGLVLFGVLATTQCGGGDGGTGPTPNTIAVSAGNNQIGAAGAPLPESLTVIVKDQSAAVLAGVTVTFTITAGGGGGSPASPRADAPSNAQNPPHPRPKPGTPPPTPT